MDEYSIRSHYTSGMGLLFSEVCMADCCVRQVSAERHFSSYYVFRHIGNIKSHV